MHRSPSIIAMLTIVGVAALASGPLAGQSLTPWGDPDLQGIWTNDVVTPFERPATLGQRELLTDEELAEAAAANERHRTTAGWRPYLAPGVQPVLDSSAEYLTADVADR